MNRRERWDRDFELQKPTLFDKDELKRALSEEDKQRLLWDERFKNHQSAAPTPETTDNSHLAPTDTAVDAITTIAAEGSTTTVEVTSKKKEGFGKGWKNKFRFLF